MDRTVKVPKEFFVIGQDKPAKKKCGGKKCEKPECNKPAVSHHDQRLRAKCLELALETSRIEDAALKWAQTYWEWVRDGT
jgi:hypothetical protein